MPPLLRLAYRPWEVGPLAMEQQIPEGVDFCVSGPAQPFPGGPLQAKPELFDPGHALAGLSKRCYLDAELRTIVSLQTPDPAVEAKSLAYRLCEIGNDAMGIGVVSGHNLMDRLEELLVTGVTLANLQTGEPFTQLHYPTVAAVARFGHEPLLAALGQGARIVLAGSATLPAMVAATLSEQFDWKHQDERLTAAASLADQLQQELGTLTLEESAIQPVGLNEAATQVPIEIVYQEGFSCSVLLGASPSADETTGRKQLALATEAAGGAFHAAAFAPLESSSPPLALVEAIGDSEASVFNTLSQARNALRPYWSIQPGFSPQAVPRLRHWETSAPAELIEWSVDIREARAWRD